MAKRLTIEVEGILEEEVLSETKVLKSNAGFYIGHEYFDTEMSSWLPYNRISDYFRTRRMAETYLVASGKTVAT